MGVGPLGQRQALSPSFSLSLTPFLSGPCPCPWGFLESLGVLVAIIGLVLWPACLSFGSVGTGWVWERGPPIPL